MDFKAAIYGIVEWLAAHLLWDLLASFIGIHVFIAFLRKFFIEKLEPNLSRKRFYWKETVAGAAFLCVLAAAFQSPSENLHFGKRPHFHITLLTFDKTRTSHIWLHLTNNCFTPKDASSLPFNNRVAGIVAVPVESDKTNESLQLAVWNDSFENGSIFDVELEWAGNCSIKDSTEPGGWHGNVPDLDRGFSDSVVWGIGSPVGVRAGRPLTFPLLQFTNRLESKEPIHGIAEIHISGVDFHDIVYAFGIQFVEDSNRTAYVTEEAITRYGLDVKFVEPQRSR